MTRAIFQPFAIGVGAAAIVASGVVPTAERQSPVASVFTAQQATAGKMAYAKNCASCHMPDLSGNNEIPPLAGKAFMGTWGTRSTKDLFDYMSAAMPYGGPSLSTETYTSIVAFILQSNGAAAGMEALSASTVSSIVSLTAPRVTPPAAPAPPRRAETTAGVAASGSGGDDAVPAP
jgi:mono/diheme cytochrome c family protein